jgi:hypothetical protein
VIRERDGGTLPAVFRTEGQALNWVRSRIAKGTIVNADESPNWNELHSRFEMKRINHEEAYSLDGACTNWAPCRSRPPSPYRERLFAPLCAGSLLAGG